MQSKTSFFNRALFLWNAKRFWPLWAGYTLFWFLVGPMATGSQLGSAEPRPFFVVHQIISTANATAPAITAIAAAFFAMALYSYMYQSRSVVMIHSLPLRRETLYITNVISGVTFFLVSHLVAALGMTLLCAFYHVLDMYAILVWFAVTTLSSVFFFGFATFCAQFTGQILTLPVFYGILNVLAVVLEYLVRSLAALVIFGYQETGSLLLSPLSPIVQMYSSLRCDYIYDESVPFNAHEPIGYTVEGLDCLWWYALAGLVFVLLGFLLYRRRSSEAAGDTVSVAWAKPIFSTGVGLCCALSLGQGVYELISSGRIDAVILNLPKMLVCMLIAGLIGYYAAEMLMRKTFRVFRQTRAGAVVLCALLIVGSFVLTLDPAGYEQKVPALNEIEYVSVDIGFAQGVYSRFSMENNPQVVAALLDVHQAVINDKERQLSLRRELWGQREYGYAEAATVEEIYPVPTDKASASPSESLERVTRGFGIRYTLTDGTELERWYSLTALRSDLAQSDSLTAKLDRLLNDTDVLLRSRLYWRGDDIASDRLKIVGAELIRYAQDGESAFPEAHLELEAADAQRLFDALLRDFASGRVRSDMFAPDIYYTADTDISFTFLENGVYSGSRTITPEPEMTDTLALLTEYRFVS